jgi:hypothetical protein
MRTLRLLFAHQGASFDLDAPLSGELECAVQNALVNIGSVQGSDGVYPTKGTRLLRQALNGVMFDNNAATHASNYAALDTLKFIKAADYPDTVERITTMAIKPASYSQGRLVVDAQFTSSAGRVSGTLTTLT